MVPVLKTYQLQIGHSRKNGVHRVKSNLNLELKAGEFMAVLGPNGSGKSTLLNTLFGLKKALSGEVMINGQPLARIAPDKRAKILSIVLTQMPSGQLTGRELVEMGRYPHTGWMGRLTPTDRQAIDKAIALTKTNAFADKPLYALSDGQRQRLVIARCLAQDTPLILLDEPTSFLDVSGRIEMLDFLAKLAQQEKKAILISTHEIEMVMQFADQLLILGKGDETAFGMPEELALNGLLDQHFAKGDIRFDLRRGVFSKSHRKKTEIEVTGTPEEALIWTRLALVRKGISLEGTEIRVSRNRKGLQWQCQGQAFHSISKLCTHLARLQVKSPAVKK